VTRPPTREEASRILGVPADAEALLVKQAYRRLAREHHPDRGGDPGTFHVLQQAYERLVDADEASPPLVARGRPSRPPVPFDDETERADLTSVDWAEAVEDGERPLTRDRLAVWLASGENGTVRPLLATSRSPGSKLNRLSAKLAPEFTSRLHIAPVLDDRGARLVAVELVASSRRARKALEKAKLDGVWVRTRRSSSTLLRCTLPPSTDPRTTAVRVADRVMSVLDPLGWPLSGWVATSEGSRQTP
jgi:curved DNA-binding protein CbpA